MSFDFNRMLKRELNVGKKEQRIRFWAGIALLLLSLMFNSALLIVVGIALIVTAVLRWCPAYSGLGKSTVQPGEEENPGNPA
jgi:hypothetical protein